MRFYCEFTVQKEVELSESDAKILDAYAKENGTTVEKAIYALRNDFYWELEEAEITKMAIGVIH